MLTTRTDDAAARPGALAPLALAAALAGTLASALAPGILLAGAADIVEGRISALGDGRYRIDATVRHADEGWEHYANRWDVLDPEGNVIGSRELLHPHVDEQPFTRSLTLEIPAGVERVTLRAHDSVHGLEGGAVVELDVPR